MEVLKPQDNDWIARDWGLATLSGSVRAELARGGRKVRFSKGETVFGGGKEPEDLLLLLSGTVRVQQVSDTGRMIVLYRVDAGQSCVLTNACLMAHEELGAEGVAETDVEAVAIPRDLFDRLVATSEEFRRFVFTAYARRMTDLFRVIEDVAFGRIDMRLSERLLALAGESGSLATTHQALADELGTAREVVSRQLTDFQKRGWIAQARGRVDLLDKAALGRVAAG